MSRRSGGRQARLAERLAPLTEEAKPVHPGETGGTFMPLSKTDMAAIAENAYRILAEIGFGSSTPHCTKLMVEVGAIMGDDGRLRIPRSLVDHTLSICEHNLTLHGIDPKHDLELSGQRVHFSTGGAAVHIADPVNNTYKNSTSKDLYDMARIANTCEHIHMFQRMCVLRDIDDTKTMDLNTLYNSVMGSSKHIGTSFAEADHVEAGLKMLHHFAGSEEAWRAPLCEHVQLLCSATNDLCRRIFRMFTGRC